MTKAFIQERLDGITSILAEGRLWGISEKKQGENYFKWYRKTFGVVGKERLSELVEDYTENRRQETTPKIEELELANFVVNNMIRKQTRKKNMPLEMAKEELFICSNFVYKLELSGCESHEIMLDQKQYHITNKVTDLENLERIYRKRIEVPFCGSYTAEIHSIAEKGIFYDKKTNIGLEKNEKGFFTYTKVEPYTLYEKTNNKYYSFGDAKIGIRLEFRDNNLVWHDPVVMNEYMHPALPGLATYQKICPGSFSYESLRRRQEDEGKQVRIAFEEARRMIERGYFLGMGAWNQLTDSKYERQQAKSIEGRRITNT